MAFPVPKAAGSTKFHAVRMEQPASPPKNENRSYWDIFFDPDPAISTRRRLISAAAPGLIGAAFVAAPLAAAAGLLLACTRGSTGRSTGTKKTETTGSASNDLKEDPRPALVSVETERGQGTGFFVKHNGRPLVVTARHNVAFTQRFWVARFEGPREKTVTVIHPFVRLLAWDRGSDLAVLEVENLQDGIAALELSDTEPARNAELVAWGTPSIPTLSGEPLRMIPTKVNLHDIREEAAFDLWTQKPTTLLGKGKRLYLDGKILPGNSGGPVVDPQTGRVVGVISMGAPAITEGIATSVEAVRNLLKRISPPQPLTKAKAEAAVRRLLESFLPLSDPAPDVERFAAPRELGLATQKQIVFLQQLKAIMKDCGIGANKAGPMTIPENVCQFFKSAVRQISLDRFWGCLSDIPLCARSDLAESIQGDFRAMLRYKKGEALKSVKVIEEPTEDADPNLWHVKASWTFGDQTVTERLLLEQAVGEVFVRILGSDGNPVVKVEVKPEPAPQLKQKKSPRARNRDPYDDTDVDVFNAYGEGY